MRTKNLNATTMNRLAYLQNAGRDGQPRVRRLTWGQLEHTYRSEPATSPVRRLIANEAKRCGYTPSAILGLNRHQSN